MSKAKNFYLIHKSVPKIDQNSYTNRSINIFEGVEAVNEYFPTCPIEKPFSIFSSGRKNKFPIIQTQQLKQNECQTLKKTSNLNQQQIYKMNETPRQKYTRLGLYNTQRKKKCKILKPMADIKSDKKFVEKMYSSVASKEQNRWDEKVNKYLFSKSMANQVVYNQDLRTRCGDQYFQQNMRDRHKQEMKPLPFVYSIKSEINLDTMQFAEYMKNIHPEIIIRDKLKLKGVNRCRIKTETQKSKYESVSKIKTDSTTMQAFTYPKIQSMASNYQ